MTAIPRKGGPPKPYQPAPRIEIEERKKTTRKESESGADMMRRNDFGEDATQKKKKTTFLMVCRVMKGEIHRRRKTYSREKNKCR